MSFLASASWWLFSQQAKSYLAYCAYRSDIIIRETAIVGVIGSVGLGWQLQESLSSFAWQEVTIVLIAYSSIAIVGELINGKIKFCIPSFFNTSLGSISGPTDLPLFSLLRILCSSSNVKFWLYISSTTFIMNKLSSRILNLEYAA